MQARAAARPADQSHFGAHGVRVGAQAYEPNRDARGVRFVAIDFQRSLVVVEDQIEIAVVVQIGLGHAAQLEQVLQVCGD